MFLNCLLLDLTVIDLMSSVHVDKILVEIAKNLEMRTSGGGVVSDFGHPRTRGGGRGVLKSASTKSHASEKIKNHYFRTLRIGSDVFFDADSKSPHMT